MEFIYFEESWNEKPTEIEDSSTNTPRVAGSDEDAHPNPE